MTITAVGPDEAKHEFPDDTPPEVISRVMAKAYGGEEAAAKPIYDKTDPRFENPGPAEALRGVPLIGAGVNKAGAMVSALAHPLSGVGSEGASIMERYGKNLAQEEAAQADYEKEHPIRSAVEGAVGGGLALGGAAGAVPAVAKGLGMVGKVIPATIAATGSGAALGGADAALRGEDPVHAAEIGALTGGAGVIGGKIVGKVWDKAAGMFREKAPAVPTRTIPAAGEDIPVRESVVSRDAGHSQNEQADLTGGNGPQAQAEALAAQKATQEAFERAHGNVSASLDPTGTSPAATPMAAGEAVGSEAAAQEAARAAAEAQRLQGVGNETEAIRGALNTSPTPGVLAPTPRTAAETIQQHLINARDTMAAARDRAYEALRGTVGEFNPAVFRQTAQRIRQQLAGGTEPVNVSDTLTPHTANALRDIETNVGQQRFENQVQPPQQMGPDGRPVPRPITADTIDEARKRLISMQRAANDTARRTGDFTDVRGMRRVIHEFDNHVERAAQTPGGFSGDPQELLARLGNARGLHTQLKRAFGPQNPQDVTGKAIEKIVGKRGVDPAEAETVTNSLFGSASEPGGANQAALVRRLVGMYGPNSPQVAALKQGLLSHVADTPAGLEAMTREKAADRIHKLFTGAKGVSLSQALFEPAERARLLAHANSMRTAADPLGTGRPLVGSTKPTITEVDKKIAKWSGRNGGERASPKTIVDDLIGSTGAKGTSPDLARYIQRNMTPETVAKVKQGVWSRITEAADGKIPWQDQKVGQRIMEFLNGDGKGLADVLYTKAERDAMRELGEAHLANLPIEGTKPQGSGPVIQRLTHAAIHSALPIVGMHVGGFQGAAVGMAAQKAVKNIANKVGGASARVRHYGPQPKRAVSQLPQRFGALGGAVLSDQSSR